MGDDRVGDGVAVVPGEVRAAAWTGLGVRHCGVQATSS
jgi:hypothetical protein